MGTLKIDLKKFKNVSFLTVALTLLLIAIGSLYTVEANAGELFVVNQGPCLIYKDKLDDRSLNRVTDIAFNVDLATCVKIIGSLADIYRIGDYGVAYGLHQGSDRDSHIAIRASADEPNDHRAWVKDRDEEEWSQWAENWWDPVFTIQ